VGQPTPPGDLPLIEGLDPSWNEFVSAIPEDRRAELGPKLKERISGYEPLRQWEQFQKSGITPDQAGTALNLFTLIENDPKQVYDVIAKHLNLTPAETKAVVEEIQDAKDDGDDPRIKRMEQQLETLAQIALTQRQMSAQEKLEAQEEANLSKELDALKTKYGSNFDEEQIVMRMIHKGVTAEQAYQEYEGMVNGIRSRRPAPMVMGAGGAIPNRAIDPKKLSSQDTRKLVAQMLEHANNEQNQ
jgi:hypothetical protein